VWLTLGSAVVLSVNLARSGTLALSAAMAALPDSGTLRAQWLYCSVGKFERGGLFVVAC
jgi:hypothetical protein